MSIEELENKLLELERIEAEQLESIKKERDDLKNERGQLKGRIADLETLEEKLRREIDEVLGEVDQLKKTIENQSERIKQLEEQLSLYASLDNFFTKKIQAEFSNLKKPLTDEVLKEIMDRLQERLGRPLSKLVVDATEGELEVMVHREKVTAEESTLRGQIALLISEGEFDRYKSARSVGRALQQLGYKVSETSGSIISELDWFTKQRIIKYVEGHGWIVKDKSRIVVKQI